MATVRTPACDNCKAAQHDKCLDWVRVGSGAQSYLVACECHRANHQAA